jgi:uncharacterized membrane protein
MILRTTISLILLAAPVGAEVVRIDVQSRDDVLAGRSFGAAGPYEKLSGTMYFAVDPRHDVNRIIADIDRAWSQDAVAIDFPGARDTFPFGINPRGDIAGSYIDQQGQRHAFILDKHGTFTSIDLPGVDLTIAAGKIDPAGTTAIGTLVGLSVTSFLRDRRGRLTPVHVPASVGFIGTIATGVSPDGKVVGWYFDAVGIHGFLLDDGVYTTIDFPGADHTRAIDITPQGDILGVYQIGTVEQVFLLSDGVFTSGEFPGATSTGNPNGIVGMNPRGEIVGEYEDALTGRLRGFHLYKGRFTTIDWPGAVHTFLNDIDPAGNIIGHYTDSDGRRRGFLLRR